MEESSWQLSPRLAQCYGQRKKKGEEKGRKTGEKKIYIFLLRKGNRRYPGSWAPLAARLLPSCAGHSYTPPLVPQNAVGTWQGRAAFHSRVAASQAPLTAYAFQCRVVLHQDFQFPRKFSLCFDDFQSFPMSRGVGLPPASPSLTSWGTVTLRFPSASLLASLTALTLPLTALGFSFHLLYSSPPPVSSHTTHWPREALCFLTAPAFQEWTFKISHRMMNLQRMNLQDQPLKYMGRQGLNPCPLEKPLHLWQATICSSQELWAKKRRACQTLLNKSFL